MNGTRAQHFFHTAEDLKLTWRSLGFPKFRKSTPTSIYRISEITSGKRLLKESRLMKHCVFSYLGMCSPGKAHIFSFSEEIKATGKPGVRKPRVTIEVKDGKIVQAYGKNNSLPPVEFIALISDWCEKNGIANL